MRFLVGIEVLVKTLQIDKNNGTEMMERKRENVNLLFKIIGSHHKCPGSYHRSSA